jgi:hypothetical protein
MSIPDRSGLAGSGVILAIRERKTPAKASPASGLPAQHRSAHINGSKKMST